MSERPTPGELETAREIVTRAEHALWAETYDRTDAEWTALVASARTIEQRDSCPAEGPGMSNTYDPMGLREPIIVVQRLGVVTFGPDLPERQVEVFTRHLRHAWEELSSPASGTLSGTPSTDNGHDCRDDEATSERETDL